MFVVDVIDKARKEKDMIERPKLRKRFQCYNRKSKTIIVDGFICQNYKESNNT